MPYIGNSQNVGDHVNNFKVLDDISSYTATFNGSAASVVSTTDETIRIADHRFVQGQRVTYSNGGGGNIGGLTSGAAYYVSFDTGNTIKLATSKVNADNNTVINLASVGSGSSHTLTAAFDSVNTEFKLTYGGKGARLINAAQLNVAINNVVQRPNLNPLSFTEGFAVKDGSTIIFQTAPNVNDIFWGSIISNTVDNFDAQEIKLDNFTGDGSTTAFNLSAIPSDPESIFVSLDGVVQHTSDNATTRAYTIVGSTLTFTAAPSNGVEIQARHIRHSSPSSPVQSFYGRSGNVTLNNTDDIVMRNGNSSGIITATTLVTSSDLKQGTSTPNAFTTSSPDQHLFIGKNCMQGCITTTKQMSGSGSGTFDLGKLWLVDDTSIELFITISRSAGQTGFTTTLCKAFIVKAYGGGMRDAHILYQSQSGGSAPIISSITAGGYTGTGTSAHGTQINVTSGDNNGTYRLVCHYTAISKNEMY
mgnify:CR=1 FL=1